MKDIDYWREMLAAFSYPVGLFLVLPLLIVGVTSGSATFVGMVLMVAMLLFPIVVVGLLLSPWAGGNLPESKLPSFAMAGLAALAPAFIFWSFAGAGMLAAWAFLALPASLLGAILFIGGCERARERLALPDGE